MVEMAISRMNFLDQRHGPFTYRSMIVIMIGWVAVLAAIYGFLLLRQMDLKGDISLAKKGLENLNIQKDKQLEMVAMLGRQRVGTSAKEDLSAIILSRPRWSAVLNSLTKSLPPQVWLDSISVKTGKEGEKELQVKGRSKSQRALTSFIMRLESGGMFGHTEIIGTKRASGTDGVSEYELLTTPVLRKF